MNVLEFIREQELTSNYALAIIHIVSASKSENPVGWIKLAIDDLKAEEEYIANADKRSLEKFLEIVKVIESQYKDRSDDSVVKES